MLEQPLARGSEADLDGYRSPIPIAADESALGLDDVPGLVGRFDVINIKLDKCGGLTEALLMAEEARRLGLGVMVGNMVGTSLAMAPAFIVGQHCDVVDLDGPTFLREDRTPASNIATARSGARTRCGDRGVGRVSARRRAIQLVRPAARADDPVPHQHVGAILLLTGCARCWSIT